MPKANQRRPAFQPGNLNRLFEELCRIKVSVRDIVAKSNDGFLKDVQLPDGGGVYAFWWQSAHTLKKSGFEGKIGLPGPGGSFVEVTVGDDWLALDTGLPIPLYVGKTSRPIKTRIREHLKIQSPRVLERKNGIAKSKPPRPDCQLRVGVDHFFPTVKDTRQLIIENIWISFVELPGATRAADRCYLETRAVGLMHPPFNAEVER